MEENNFHKVMLVKKNVMFLGWIIYDGTPVFKGEDTELFTCCNADDLKIGMWGDIYYKANSRGGNHYFEPYD
ncbi:hypothetical protein ACFCP7_08650 [Paenibacillus elgii]